MKIFAYQIFNHDRSFTYLLFELLESLMKYQTSIHINNKNKKKLKYLYTVELSFKELKFT